MKRQELTDAEPELGPDGSLIFCVNVEETKTGNSCVTLSSHRREEIIKYLKYVKPRLNPTSSQYIFGGRNGLAQVGST